MKFHPTGKWQKPRPTVVKEIRVVSSGGGRGVQTAKITLPAGYTIDEFATIFNNMSDAEKLEFLRSAE